MNLRVVHQITGSQDTVIELADAVGVNPQTIGFLERGDYKPSLELALSIAEVFGVSVELLFSFEPFPSLSQALQKGRE